MKNLAVNLRPNILDNFSAIFCCICRMRLSVVLTVKQRLEQGHSDTTANGLFFQPITKLNNNAFLQEVRLGSVLHNCRTCDLISADLY